MTICIRRGIGCCKLQKIPKSYWSCDVQVKPLTEWEKLDMSGMERRKLCCSITFHMIAITCVIWSLYVLIDRWQEREIQFQILVSAPIPFGSLGLLLIWFWEWDWVYDGDWNWDKGLIICGSKKTSQFQCRGLLKGAFKIYWIIIFMCSNI